MSNRRSRSRHALQVDMRRELVVKVSVELGRNVWAESGAQCGVMVDQQSDALSIKVMNFGWDGGKW